MSVEPSARTTGNAHKLEFPLNTRKHFCAVQAMEHWHRFPIEAVESLGDLQKPPGHGSGHPALGVPAGARVGADGPRCSC